MKVEAALLPTFPLTSACSAWAVYVPRSSAEEASTDQVPLVKRVVVKVCTGVPVADGPA